MSDSAPDANDWSVIDHTPSHSYLLPAVVKVLTRAAPATVLDLGCGDGRLTQELVSHGYKMTGVDLSASGISRAQVEHPSVTFRQHDMAEALAAEMHGAFDAVIAVEVIEHLLLPGQIFERADEALRPDGRLVITTPYHGYLKNLALAMSGKLENHFMAAIDYGHVKFFSPKTLRSVAEKYGFEVTREERVGRVPALAASMVLTCRRRSTEGRMHG